MSTAEQGPRERMLQSAIQLFRERGVAGTSLRDVVEHSGAPRGSIYHHFPQGKGQLVAEATALANQFVGRLITHLGTSPEGIATLVDHWADALQGSDFQAGCPIVAAALADDELPQAQQAAGTAFGSWQEQLAATLSQRPMPRERAEELAALIVASVEGALIMARAQRDAAPLRRVGGALQRLLA